MSLIPYEMTNFLFVKINDKNSTMELASSQIEQQRD